MYNFERTKQILVHTFGRNDGMISHVKFVKKKEGSGKKIIYVKDTCEIMCINLEVQADFTVKTTISPVGRAKDAIIALSVSDGQLREGNANDLESGDADFETYNVICLDESQNVTIFAQNKAETSVHHFQVANSAGIPTDIAKKDLFGMGYPYFICLYN